MAKRVLILTKDQLKIMEENEEDITYKGFSKVEHTAGYDIHYNYVLNGMTNFTVIESYNIWR